MSVSAVQAIGLEFIITTIGVLLAIKSFGFRNKGLNYFWRFMVVLNIYLFINIPIRIDETGLHDFSPVLMYWLYSGSLVFMTFSMYYWFLFILKLTNSKLVDSVIKMHISIIPAFLMIPLCIINRWTGWLFYIENNIGHKGTIVILRGFIAYIYLILNQIWLLHCLRDKNYKRIAQFGLYAMFPVLFGIVLQVIYGGSFLLAGVVICASIMYIDICLENQKASDVKEMKEMLVQTAETLASAIDAKDEYTHGHSTRVAQYSRTIAERAGYPEEYVEKVYFSGLLHDVGKIGVPDWIINKNGKPTAEEFGMIKQHSIKGRNILAHIRKLPYLTMGAKYHHERYDGLGYPEGLKATDIPDIARIIAVADAYDAMTSNRSYRKALSQEVVRGEIEKGAGRQFDPEYAEILLHLIDEDKDFRMREKDNSTELYCREYYKKFYEGILLSPFEIKMHMQSTKLEADSDNLPTFILFDAVDSRVHIEDHEKKFYGYTNYCDIRVDGVYTKHDARAMEINVVQKKERIHNNDAHIDIDVTVLKQKDHVLIKLFDGFTEITATVVLTDSSRFVYLGITGKQCHIEDISTQFSSEMAPEGTIKRIADEIRYFDRPAGDIPNIQIDSWRTESTKGIPVNKELNVSFFFKNTPFARLIWHCPYLVLFDSADGNPHKENCREYAFVRFDGESWQADPNTTNYLQKTITHEFKDWINWKRENKEGRIITVDIKRNDNQVVMKTTCGGIELENTTTINGEFNNIYFSLSGDQVVLESIKINKNE